METSPSKNPRDVPWINIVQFVRQLSHDLRNQLNAAELQSAYLSELTRDAELKTEIKRLRDMISELGRVLQKLSAELDEPNPGLMKYAVSEFMEDLQKKIAKEFAEESSAIDWDVRLNEAAFNVDPQLLEQMFIELFRNAFQHERAPGRISASARIDSGDFVFKLGEPKARFDLPTENWGRQPFGKVGRGHYGLGLNLARSIVEAHNGNFEAQYDSKGCKLVTTIRLPLSGKS